MTCSHSLTRSTGLRVLLRAMAYDLLDKAAGSTPGELDASHLYGLLDRLSAAMFTRLYASPASCLSIFRCVQLLPDPTGPPAHPACRSHNSPTSSRPRDEPDADSSRSRRGTSFSTCCGTRKLCEYGTWRSGSASARARVLTRGSGGSFSPLA